MLSEHEKVKFVLSALLLGLRVETEGKVYVMDADYRLCQIAWDADGSKVLLIVNMGEGIALSHFIHWAGNIPDKDVFQIAGNLVLNNLNKKQQ